MSGCDGKMKQRHYYTEFASDLKSIYLAVTET